jgi:hypothetical protein
MVNKSRAKTLLIYFLPLLAFLALIFSRKLQPKGQTGLPVAESVQEYVTLQASWMTNFYEEVTSLSQGEVKSRVDGLSFRPVDVDDFNGMAGSLRTTLVRAINSFKASRFDEFMKNAKQNDEYKFDPKFIEAFREVLAKDYGEPPESDLAVFDAWWQTNSNNGKWATETWRGVSWSNSFCLITKIESPAELDGFAYAKFLERTVPNCGVVGTTSLFVYSPSPEEILKLSGSVTVADAYFLSKFESNGQRVAYPLMFRYYWFPENSSWLPLRVSWGYNGPTPGRPVF